MIERILETVLVVIAINTGVNALSHYGSADDEEESLLSLVRHRRLPVTSIVLTSVLILGSALEAVWPGALDALRSDPSSAQWWRVLTAPFVQEGVAGALFNIVTAAVVLALAEWRWGRLTAATLWLLAAWAPVGDVAGLAGYHPSASNATAYSAGSSGATYFVAATLCAALLLGSAGRGRLLGLIAPAIALGMWVIGNDGHGVLFCEGFVLGAVVCLVLDRLCPPVSTARPASGGTRVLRGTVVGASS